MTIQVTYKCDNPNCRSTTGTETGWLIVNTMFIKNNPSWVPKREMSVNHEVHFCSKQCFITWFFKEKYEREPVEVPKQVEEPKKYWTEKRINGQREYSEKSAEKKQKEFDRVYDVLGPRLNQLGEVRAGDAWNLAGGHYQYTTVIFKTIMETMIEQGKARREKRGQYMIIKPNEKVSK